MDAELASYIAKRQEALDRRYGRDLERIEANAALTPEQKEARKADLWGRTNDRKDELKRLEKKFR